MSADTLREPDLGAVRQFSVFVENKVGRLHELVESLGKADVGALIRIGLAERWEGRDGSALEGLL